MPDVSTALHQAISLAENDLAAERSRLDAAEHLARQAVEVWTRDVPLGSGEAMAHYLVTRAAVLHEAFMPLTEVMRVPDFILVSNMPGVAP